MLQFTSSRLSQLACSKEQPAKIKNQKESISAHGLQPCHDQFIPAARAATGIKHGADRADLDHLAIFDAAEALAIVQLEGQLWHSKA